MSRIVLETRAEVAELENSINRISEAVNILGLNYVVVSKYFREKEYDMPGIVYELEEITEYKND